MRASLLKEVQHIEYPSRVLGLREGLQLKGTDQPSLEYKVLVSPSKHFIVIEITEPGPDHSL